jgi:hypothetical protein
MDQQVLGIQVLPSAHDLVRQGGRYLDDEVVLPLVHAKDELFHGRVTEVRLEGEEKPFNEDT